jgi:hypothetical protein
MEDVGAYIWPFGLFYGHLVHFRPFGIFCGRFFMVIWYIFPALVCCTKKNLATLLRGLPQHVITLLKMGSVM